MSRQRTEATLEGLPARFWSVLRRAPHRLLMLDYDGTLAPFHLRPEEAMPSARTLDLLAQVAAMPDSTVAVISGRRLSDLSDRLGHLPIALMGEHGWDVLGPDGRVSRHPLSEACAAGLHRAMRAAESAPWRRYVEAKRASLVLHTRGLPREEAEAMRRAALDAWQPEADGHGLRLDSIDGGLELRAQGRDKGSAVRELLAAAPPDAVAVYVGDDVTDEDAFRSLRPGDYALRVGSATRESCAKGRLESVDEVTDFLELWAGLATRRAASRRSG